MKTTLSAFGTIALGLALASPAAAALDDSLVTAVFSSARKDYVREKTPDGSFKKETYVVANGGYAPGLARDRSIDATAFPGIVKVMAGYLGRQNYFPVQDTKSADLLLVIAWGTTIPFNDLGTGNGLDNMMGSMNRLQDALGHNPTSGMLRNDNVSNESSVDGIQSAGASVNQAAREDLEGQLYEMQMFNGIREKADEHNARLLGYVKEINWRNNGSRFAGGGAYYDDLISDIETERYYVIVTAYDFQAAQEKKRKILWTTRVSIQAQGNRFDESLATMLANASRYFGKDSGSLVRQYQKGTVKLGDLKFLGTVPEPTTPDKPAESK